MLLSALLLVAVVPASVSQEVDGGSDQDAAGDERPDWIQPLGTEPSTDGDWIRPEAPSDELPQIPSQAAEVYRAEAFGVSRDHKMRALAGLEHLWATGDLDPEDPVAVELLAFLATEPLDEPIRRAGELVNDFPLVRIKALELLGALGGASSVRVIRSVVLREERDRAVLAAAVGSLARASIAFDDEVAGRLGALLERMNAGDPDNRLALAIVEAVYASHLRLWGSVPVDLYRSLFDVVRGPYASPVRARAMEVIELMRG